MKEPTTLNELVKVQQDPNWKNTAEHWVCYFKVNGKLVKCTSFKTKTFAEMTKRMWESDEGYSCDLKYE